MALSVELDGEPRRSSAFQERVLVLAPVGRDAQLARQVLHDAGFEATICDDTLALCGAFAEGAGALLIAEEALGARGTADLVAALSRQPAWSDLPILVVMAREGAPPTTDTPALVEQLGNVTLIERPVRIRTLSRAISVALAARRRQYEARDLMAALERGVRQRDEFLAMLGHELRNPISAIAYALASLERAGIGADGARQRDVIHRQADHLARLVDDLLDVARVTSGKIVLETRNIDIVEIAGRAVLAVESDARARGVAVAAHLPPDSLYIAGDAVRIEQVFANLLGNATKYTPAGGRVDLFVEATPREVAVRVVDTGVGIAPGTLPVIFELFSQDDRTLDRARGGLGIGLTLVRTLVELHRGTVQAQSAGPGKGSEFVVRLPAITTVTPEAPSTAGADSRGGVRCADAFRDVLLVEDNEDVRASLQELLALVGHSVDVAAEGTDAVARALARPPAAMFVDIGLPGIDGYEVARRVRSALGGGIFLVALTGYGQPEDRRRALEAGFDAHLTKPVSVDRLEHLLHDAAAARSRSVA